MSADKYPSIFSHQMEAIVYKLQTVSNRNYSKEDRITLFNVIILFVIRYLKNN